MDMEKSKKEKEAETLLNLASEVDINTEDAKLIYELLDEQDYPEGLIHRLNKNDQNPEEILGKKTSLLFSKIDCPKFYSPSLVEATGRR